MDWFGFAAYAALTRAGQVAGLSDETVSASR